MSGFVSSTEILVAPPGEFKENPCTCSQHWKQPRWLVWVRSSKGQCMQIFFFLQSVVCFYPRLCIFFGPSWGYFPVMFYSRPVLKPKGSTAPRMTDSVNRILFIHLIQNGPFSWTPGIVNRDVISFLCVCWISFSEKPKAKRFTTAKAPLSAAINIEELMSPSEDEHDQEEDEWRPEKPEKCRRTSKKTKAVGVRVGLRPGGVKPVNSLWLQGYVMNAMCFLFVSVCV